MRVRAQVAVEAPRIQAVAHQCGRSSMPCFHSPKPPGADDLYVRRSTSAQNSPSGAAATRWWSCREASRFVPNDLSCNNSTDQLLIVTGPNMGGKSTYLRQNALIVIMAQMGSFVPADEARVGLVDRVFTRVGASDNLARGRSTFMVEMIETANILNTATPRSLILLDEVGRGTATFDGLSLAWSIAEYLVTQPDRRARTLFATHYQELTRLDRLYPGVKNYCVTVRRSGHQIIFFHKVMAGVANKSYGIDVARLAGVPSPVIERAREILSRLEKKDMDLSGSRRSTGEVLEELQKKLF